MNDPQSYGVTWQLENWARWMRAKEGPEGLPDSACGGLTGYNTIDRDSDAAYEKLDVWLAGHTDAAVSALAPSHQCAIYHRYLDAVYRFPRGSYEEVLEQAIARVGSALLRRGVWMGDGQSLTTG